MSDRPYANDSLLVWSSVAGHRTPPEPHGDCRWWLVNLFRCAAAPKLARRRLCVRHICNSVCVYICIRRLCLCLSVRTDCIVYNGTHSTKRHVTPTHSAHTHTHTRAQLQSVFVRLRCCLSDVTKAQLKTHRRRRVEPPHRRTERANVRACV